jgi:predicted GNAT family acetyltransferase
VVRDHADLHRYELEVDGQTAIAAYRRSPGVVTFTHTEVPEVLEGHGVGRELIQGALDDVRSRGEKVIALCPFVAAFIRRHPDYQDLLARPLV